MEELQQKINHLNEQLEDASFMEALSIKDQILEIEQEMGTKTCTLDADEHCESCSG